MCTLPGRERSSFAFLTPVRALPDGNVVVVGVLNFLDTTSGCNTDESVGALIGERVSFCTIAIGVVQAGWCRLSCSSPLSDSMPGVVVNNNLGLGIGGNCTSVAEGAPSC